MSVLHVRCWNDCLQAYKLVSQPMIGENRQLVTNEPVDFEK